MKKLSAAILVILAFFAFAKISFAQESESKVDYSKEVIVDSDLDGLTDQGEIQIYGTDHKDADTDGDGLMDGVEVVQGTSPLDSTDPYFSLTSTAQETPWAWYVSRAAGIIGFVFLWLTIILGLSIRNPWLKKIIGPIYSFDFHCFTAVAAVFWSLVHGTSLLFDKIIGFGVKNVLIPFFSQTTLVDVRLLALGIIAFWLMVVMAVTSYLRAHMSHWLWRALHFMNPLAFIFIVIHGYKIGTDMKNIYISNIYLFSSALLALIYLSSVVFMISNKIKQRQQLKG